MQTKLQKYVYANLNIDNIHINTNKSQLEKKLSDINKSTYVYSLIENVKDKKKFDIIKREMNNPVIRNNQTRLAKANPFSQKLNIFNYRNFDSKSYSISSNERETMGIILKKLEKKFAIHQKQKSKFNSLNYPLLSFYRPTITESTRYPTMTEKTFYDRYNKKDQINYNSNSLNKTLFTIVKQAQLKQNEFEETMNSISKEIKKGKRPKEKVILKKKKKEKFIQQGEFSFPIINKIINGDENKNQMIEIKNKLYEKYKIKKQNLIDKKFANERKIFYNLESESESESESKSDDD